MISSAWISFACDAVCSPGVRSVPSRADVRRRGITARSVAFAGAAAKSRCLDGRAGHAGHHRADVASSASRCLSPKFPASPMAPSAAADEGVDPAVMRSTAGCCRCGVMAAAFDGPRGSFAGKARLPPDTGRACPGVARPFIDRASLRRKSPSPVPKPLQSHVQMSRLGAAAGGVHGLPPRIRIRRFPVPGRISCAVRALRTGCRTIAQHRVRRTARPPS
jgi:hypothetical protein